MKSKLVLVLAMAILCVATNGASQALAQTEAKFIRVLLDGLPLSFDIEPQIQNGRTLVPFRAIAEALNIDVAWDTDAKVVTARDPNVELKLRVGSKTAYLNGQPLALEVAPVVTSGRTLVPLRFFSEVFGCKVQWDEPARTVRIASPIKTMTVVAFYALGDSKTKSWTDLFGKDYPEFGNERTSQVSELALGWYSLDRQGNLLTKSTTGWQRPEGWQDVLEAAYKRAIRTEMVVHLTDGDGILSQLLGDHASSARAIQAIVKESRMYHGVNLDFEGLGWRANDTALADIQGRFTSFVRSLAAGLKTENRSLTLTLHPPNSVYKGYDYKALGEIADRIIVMAYEYGSNPEPEDLVIEAVEVAKKLVPPGKLLLGISAATETAVSLPTKVGIAKRHNLGGIALWRLGLISDEMWKELEGSIRAKK